MTHRRGRSFLDAFGLNWQEKGDCEAGPELHNISLNQFSSSCSSLTWGWRTNG
ncbi:hypothetical protein CY34DRAFT_799643 [Suillus luteus UH-Slu-Lm8-n1]|uniref:Uncharacterized protein n=1 Tax=Suillus luteus UH-Slu-Lm8-n1 TaxID=930992 RepID=A0A0D0BVX8_9AGAM|nr:hypothetical protein CY34DRAFT_799643 [Suillus luteus UH-Slu-Lm8-n1]